MRSLPLKTGLAATWLAVMVAVALCAPWLVPYDPLEIAPEIRLGSPDSIHWLGTDALGRDLFSRVLWGMRATLGVGACVAILSLVVGTVLGMAAASARWAEWIIMRSMDGLLAIPGILLALAFTSLVSPGLAVVIAAIAIAEVPRMARLAWAGAVALREQPYVLAARAIGIRTAPLLLRHILPGMAPALLAKATFTAAGAVLMEASLSFLGAGLPPAACSWGLIIAEGRTHVGSAPALVALPGALLALTVFSISVLGDGVRDALDPRHRARERRG